MRIPVAVLLLFLCLRAVADTPHGPPPPCTCTINFPPTQSSAVARELRRASCHCTVTSPTAGLAGPDLRGTVQASLNVDVHQLPPDHDNAVITGAVFLLALLIGALALYTAKLLRATQRLIESGKAATQRQLRAYVGVSDVVRDDLEGRSSHVNITLRNFGTTPAYKLAIAADAQIAFFVDQVPVATSASKTLGYLPPGLDFQIPRPAVLSIGTSRGDETNTTDSRIFVYGCIEYVDTFGEPHFTRFRLEEGADGQFFACAEGNETDDVMLARRDLASAR